MATIAWESLSGWDWSVFGGASWVDILTGAGLLPARLGSYALMRVRLAFGADLAADAVTYEWTDVTGDVLFNNAVAISVGRSDETSQAQPASASFGLLNDTGDYTPSNPLSANWPNVRRNTPVAVDVDLNDDTGWKARFFGYANGFTPSWDNSARVAFVAVSASGITRRLAQGKTPLRSALVRAVLADSPLAYWTFEDGSNATQGISAVDGQQPMTALAPTLLPKFSTLTGIDGSAALPDWGSGGNMFAPVVGGTAGAGGWTVETAFFSGTKTNADDVYVTVIYGPTGALFAVGPFTSISSWKVIYNDAGSITTLLTPTFASSVNPYDGKAHMVRLQAVQSGANVGVFLTIDDTYTTSTTLSSTTLGAVSTVTVGTGGLSGSVPLALGHTAVWNGTAVPNHTGPMNGNQGETPAARMTRLCAEQGVPFEIVGTYATDTTMGPQGVDTLLNLLRECEATDAGFLYDGLSALGGLSYQGISQRYGQALSMTLDVPSGHLYDLNPTDDDQRNRNKVTVSRKNGSTTPVAEDTDGPLGTTAIGTYDTQLTVNPVDDSRLAFRAGWEVHAGTIEGLRYPTLHPNLMRHAEVVQAWLNNTNGLGGAVLPGSRVDVTNPSSVLTQHPVGTVSLMLEGYTETLNTRNWTAAGNCVPNRIYDVWTVADAQLGRVQTDGSSLTADAAAGATSLTVATQAGSVIWTTTATNPGDFPLSVEIDGIQVTVTAISGTSSPQTFTVTGATVTKALLTGKAVKVWHGGVIKF